LLLADGSRQKQPGFARSRWCNDDPALPFFRKECVLDEIEAEGAGVELDGFILVANDDGGQSQVLLHRRPSRDR
jgi:hypothetical protein